tara:strand:+ start:892 stop:1158 length:267 start_codon:yes stop_codon:yes gene_type:complete
METEIVSPCVSLCGVNEDGFCPGCGRTLEERKIWKKENPDNEWKLKNIEDAIARLDEQALDHFHASYEFKKKHGLSIKKYIKKMEEKG